VRLILDTNIIVSALIWGGVPDLFLQAAAAGDVELATSPALIEELSAVLKRGHLAARLMQNRSSVERAIALYAELAVSVTPLATPRVVPRDPDDDHVIACAIAARADMIVSGDRDLLELRSHHGIDILTAAEAATQIA
jgi:putative PIN family toxin of toxin-antitoxin system